MWANTSLPSSIGEITQLPRMLPHRKLYGIALLACSFAVHRLGYMRDPLGPRVVAATRTGVCRTSLIFSPLVETRLSYTIQASMTLTRALRRLCMCHVSATCMSSRPWLQHPPYFRTHAAQSGPHRPYWREPRRLPRGEEALQRAAPGSYQSTCPRAAAALRQSSGK